MSDPEVPAIPRHYGLDWLRIGAFGLLIAFHIGLYFAPGHWIVKTPDPVDWLAWPLAAIVPWRLTLLFAVSGYATAAMIRRHAGLAGFLVERSKRLLIPLLFGMVVVVPPQEWVRMEVAGARPAFSTFLGHAAFSFTNHGGTFMPGWEHLWFLPYLWAYTLILAVLLALVPGWLDRARRGAEWLARDRRVIWAPAAVITGGMALLARVHVPGLADSADYLPALLLGFGYAHCSPLREAFARQFGAAAILSLAALGGLWLLMALQHRLPDRLEAVLGLAAGAVMSWAMVIVTFGLAERLLNRDHPWRQPLAVAIFPAYIVHQTAIVLAGWQLRDLAVTGVPAFAILLACVTVCCTLAWLAARRVPLLGVLLGMPGEQNRRISAKSRLSPA